MSQISRLTERPWRSDPNSNPTFSACPGLASGLNLAPTKPTRNGPVSAECIRMKKAGSFSNAEFTHLCAELI
jgi:hypothetical protein